MWGKYFFLRFMVYALQTDDFVVKIVKNTIFTTSMTSYLKITSFYDFQNNSIGFLVEFLWVRCDVHKPRMVYAHQIDDCVVKNVKNTIFDIYDIITQNYVI